MCATPLERDDVTEEVPDRVPAGAVLPDGRVLTFPAHRDCPCADCVAAFEALEAGDLGLPSNDEGGLPW